jgi:cbb3-type cytochrome oxidase maturation protein
MQAMFFMALVVIGLLAFVCYIFIWAVRNNQFSHLDREADRILFSDTEQPSHKASLVNNHDNDT